MRLVCGQGEPAAVPRREERVGGKDGVDLGELELVGERQRERVDLGAADHVDARRVGGARERRLERADPLRAFRAQARSRGVITRFVRPGSAFPIDSKVFRPMTIGAPRVIRLKRRRSSGKRTSSSPREADPAVAGDGGDQTDGGARHGGDCRCRRPR